MPTTATLPTPGRRLDNPRAWLADPGRAESSNPRRCGPIQKSQGVAQRRIPWTARMGGRRRGAIATPLTLRCPGIASPCLIVLVADAYHGHLADPWSPPR